MRNKRVLRGLTRAAKVVCFLFPAFLIAFFLSGCSMISLPAGRPETAKTAASTDTATAEFFAMNTYMTVTAYGPEAREAADAAKSEVYDLENRLSRTIESGDIARVNAGSGRGPVKVSSETFGLVASALRYSEETGGAFDITIAPVMDLWGFTDGNYRVPSDDEIADVLPLVGHEGVVLDEDNRTVELTKPGMKLDLGGIGKGYASDRVQEVMREYDITAGLISLGGNVAVFGSKADGSPFRIAIADPGDPASYLGVLTATGVSVITSGGYERNFTENGKTYIHIMDPDTGRPAESDLASVSIITADGVQGDSLSTALFVMGRDRALDYWRGHRDFDFVLVTVSGEVLASDGLEGIFSLADGSRTLTMID